MNPLATIQARRLREARLVREHKEAREAEWAAHVEAERHRRKVRGLRLLLLLSGLGGGVLALAR